MLTPETKGKIKEAIWDYEYFQNAGGGKVCGIGIEIRNLRIKERKDTATADIIIYTEDGHERINDCSYTISKLKGVK